LSIKIFYDEMDFRLKGWSQVKKIIEKVISEEGKNSGDLYFILTDDKTVRKINVEFLNHNYYTDVISFNNSWDDEISGEIYMSIDTIKRNAVNYNVSLKEELVRVLIHGVLHLCGYEDKNDIEKSEMTKREDHWLDVYNSL
jgi:probable rRNA maturation factor